MNERIKLIWDFRGPNAEPIAQHHAKHLSEFVISEKILDAFAGYESQTTMHHIAFLVVEKKLMDSLRVTLKPDRGQFYTEE